MNPEILQIINDLYTPQETIIQAGQYGNTRELLFQIENDSLGISRFRICDRELILKFTTHAYTTENELGRWLNFSLKTRVTNAMDHAKYPFVPENGYHPDLRAGVFVDYIISIMHEFGPLNGIRVVWMDVPGKDQEYGRYIENRQGRNDLNAANGTWTANYLTRHNYSLFLVRETYDQVYGSIDKVEAYFRLVADAGITPEP
ncbi:MAG: hypothetical protein QY330_04455 [Candidatus Dojkabacteria bacterium]|nr:MAG: hypothetical protein QY330_04455 [Candidatus Dojkabacteria bacterium]